MKNTSRDKYIWIKKTSIAAIFILSAVIVAGILRINLFDIFKAVILVAVGYFVFIGRGIDHKVDFQHK